MRIALLSDIHGNSIALDAVLDDIQAHGGVDSYWILGDLVALGPDPIGVLQRMPALPDVRFVRGNTDRYVVSSDRPPPSLQDLQSDISLVPMALEIAGTFAWTQGAITAAGWFHWLMDLPLEQHLTLPDGTQLLGVHAAPGRDDGDGMSPEMTDAEIAMCLRGCDASLICVGHTHRPMNRRIGRWHVINPGSISNSPGDDRRASYSILTAMHNGYEVRHYRTDYDRAAVLQSLDTLHHPGAAFIREHFSEA